MEDEPKNETATFSGKQLAEELMAERTESNRVDAMLQQFGEDEKHLLVEVDGVEVIGLGSKESVEGLASAAETALAKVEAHFGGKLSEVFSGLKIYFADGVIEGGGEALAGENAVIIDATKGKMSVAAAEDYLAGIGELENGDWSRRVGPEVTYAEITTVHELGHILEAKTHGQEGTAFVGLSREDAPTKYGKKASNEDYAESFFCSVYGAQIEPQRQAILDADIRRSSQRAA